MHPLLWVFLVSVIKKFSVSNHQFLPKRTSSTAGCDNLPERYCKLWSIRVVFVGSTSSHQERTIFGDSTQNVFCLVSTQLVIEPTVTYTTADVNGLKYKWITACPDITYSLTFSRNKNWLIEYGFMSAPTQYRLYGRRFLQVWWPNQQRQSTEGGWLVIQTGLDLTRLTSTCYNNTTCMQI